VPIVSAVWSAQTISANSFQLYITIASVRKKASLSSSSIGTPIKFELNVADYGFPLQAFASTASPRFRLTQLFPFVKMLADFDGCCVAYNTTLKSRQVLSFLLELL
jgi:hypothetical protein